MTGGPMSEDAILETPLHALHVELGAPHGAVRRLRHADPVPSGILAEHLHTRSHAGLFDVSHMGQALLEGADHATVAAFLETLCPADFVNLAPGRQRYTQLLNGSGGIVDDLMVTRPPSADGALQARGQRLAQGRRSSRSFASACRKASGSRRSARPALIAVQGPLAAATLARVAPGQGLEALPFMGARPARIAEFETFVSRSGYTGEDGYEISLPAAEAEMFARLLLTQPDVAPIGLGARDSLRLEAGLCLYGHELDETVDPVEAALAWSIQKRRRTEGGFPGAERVQDALAKGPKRRRVGLRPDGRAPAREGTEIVSTDGAPIGVVTSGGFGPSVGAPIAMGFVQREYAAVGTPVALVVRGKPLNARVAAMPFHPHAYYRS